MEVRDSTNRQDGDSVTVSKDLKLRESSGVVKRGTMVDTIKPTKAPAEVEDREDKSRMVLRTEFLNKA